MEEMDYDYTIDMSIADVRLLLKCVNDAIDKWPGGDPFEQEHLRYLRLNLYKITLDWEFNKDK